MEYKSSQKDPFSWTVKYGCWDNSATGLLNIENGFSPLPCISFLFCVNTSPKLSLRSGSHSCVGQKSRQAWLGSLLRVSQCQSQYDPVAADGGHRLIKCELLLVRWLCLCAWGREDWKNVSLVRADGTNIIWWGPEGLMLDLQTSPFSFKIVTW